MEIKNNFKNGMFMADERSLGKFEKNLIVVNHSWDYKRLSYSVKLTYLNELMN